jgi:hypothetical protein
VDEFSVTVPELCRERLVVENVSERKRIIQSVHDSSHLGINWTQDMLVPKCYWPGLSKDVHSYVSGME